jgi:LEA14-like dessication related protein
MTALVFLRCPGLYPAEHNRRLFLMTDGHPTRSLDGRRRTAMKAYGRRIGWVAAMSVVMGACQRVIPPTVEPTGVRLSGIGLRGATLIAGLDIGNPNDFPIETDSITFELEASNPDQPGTWTPVTQGTNRERLRIQEGGRRSVEVPIEFAYSDLSAPILSVMDKGTFRYRVSGQVLVREPRRTAASFSRTGNLSLAGTR